MKRLVSDIHYMFKGLQEIRGIRPRLLTLLALKGIAEACSPFINIYMSALIIDGIVGGSSGQLLGEYVAITISLNLIVTLVIRLCDRFIQFWKAEFHHNYEMRLSRKIIEMDYTRVENPETHRLREKINEFRNMHNSGIWRLIHSFPVLIRCLFVIAFSVTLVFSLFTAGSTAELSGIFGVAASQVFSIVLGLCVLANVVIGMYANATSTRKLFESLSIAIPFNRLFFYYVMQYIPAYRAGREIRIYDQKRLILHESTAMIGDAVNVLNKVAANQIKYSGMTTASTVLITTLIYLFVGLKALAGLFGVGSIVKYVGSINEFTNAFTTFMSELATLRANNESLRVYFDFLAIPAQMYQGTLPVEKRALCEDGDNEYEIEFRNVSFQYPASEQLTLRNVSLKFKVGERLAVVGMNGSGKTTFIKLLCRLYDPTEGEILLNGINIKKYDYAEYMSIFAVVFQDFKLFSYSLGQNVAATVDYDRGKVEMCLTEAGFADRYREMSDGAETCLYKDFDEQGVEISGGEAQKIALARALYKDAPFIILDEPTAALDPVAEFEIYAKFNTIVGNKTAIYISHRLSSCRFCDNIAVFHEGELIQRGSHDALVSESNGKYHELWHAQAQYYAESASS